MSATPQEQLEAIKAALDTALQGPPHPVPPDAPIPEDQLAYDFDNVPAKRPVAYVALDLSRRYLEGFRAGGSHPSRGGRLVTRYNAKFADNARELQRRTRLTLEDKVLVTEGGVLIGPFRFETEISIEPDTGWASGADSWIFANAA